MKPTTHQWAGDGCFETAAFPPKPPQIKVVNDDFYIYCPGNNITMLNHTVKNVGWLPNQLVTNLKKVGKYQIG